MMKTIKKLLSIAMVLALVLSLGVTAFAEEGPIQSGPSAGVRTDITIAEQSGAEGGKYVAYQLMTLTTSEDGEHFSYTVNNKYSVMLRSIANVEDNEALLAYIAALDGDGIRAFADKVYGILKSLSMPSDYGSVDGVFADLPQGYYLIAEDGAAGGATSQVIVDTAGRADITITTKEDVPSSEKKVQDDTDPAWQDSADWDIGDAVPFQLTGTLPADFESYDAYKLVFHDQESAGLTFDPTSVKVYRVAADGTRTQLTDGVGTQFGLGDGCTFHVSVDVKTAAPAAAAGDKIVVEYTSTLNTSAVIGPSGNPNEMYMEYSNDHYSDATGTTPKNKVIVFTYEMDVDKVDPDKKPLEGAGFTLYKKVAAGGAALEGHEGSYAAVGDEITGMTTFAFKGLDDGDYVLVETTVPDGYNKADDIELTISATHDKDSADPKLLTFQAKGDNELEVNEDETSVSGKFSFQVVNNTGLELPSTGGIGTTIFYVVGAVLVAGAVILLVTKKRVNGAEK